MKKCNYCGHESNEVKPVKSFHFANLLCLKCKKRLGDKVEALRRAAEEVAWDFLRVRRVDE